MIKTKIAVVFTAHPLRCSESAFHRVWQFGGVLVAALEDHFHTFRTALPAAKSRLTPRAVEIFLKGERIAAHLRASGNHPHTTVSEHMPSSPRRYADWTIEHIRRGRFDRPSYCRLV